jgi:putative flippase GtrA
MGIATFAVQLALLIGFKALGVDAAVGYAFAIALAVQFNFVTNQLFVWQDRPRAGPKIRAYVERWATFHACIAFSLVIQYAAFLLARFFMPDVAAAIVAIAVVTVPKFLSLDRLAFRPPAP